MTEITPSELKMLYVEIVIVAIMGVFMSSYAASPIEQNYISGTATNGTSASSSSVPWSTVLVDSTLGLPVGVSAILIVSSIVLIPMTIMNSLTILRLAKDFISKWV